MSLSTQDALRRLQAEERWRDIAELHRSMDEQRGSFNARAKGDPERTRLLNDARAAGLLGPVEHILFVADQTPGMLRLYPRMIQMFYGGDVIVGRCAGWTRVTAEQLEYYSVSNRITVRTVYVQLPHGRIEGQNAIEVSFKDARGFVFRYYIDDGALGGSGKVFDEAQVKKWRGFPFYTGTTVE